MQPIVLEDFKAVLIVHFRTSSCSRALLSSQFEAVVMVKSLLQRAGKAKKVETAEEREERLRLEAIEAAEHGARLEKATAARLSERRAREQQYAHLNALKIQNQWRSIMRQVTTHVLLA